MQNQSISNPQVSLKPNNTPVEQNTPQKKTNLLFPILITLVISGAVFGLAGYYVGVQTIAKKDSNQATNPTPIPPKSSPTSSAPVQTPTPGNGEITYTNTQYGFSIQFPQDFTTQVEAAGAGTREAPPNARNFYIYKIGEAEPYINRYVNFEILGLAPSYPAHWTRTQTTINGMMVTKLVDSSKASSFDIYIVELNDNQGVIEIYVSNAPDKLSVANQILSTFKFIN